MKKTCYNCKLEKELKEFSKLRRSSDGHNNCCKICLNTDQHNYYLNNRSDILKRLHPKTLAISHRRKEEKSRKLTIILTNPSKVCITCNVEKDKTEFSKMRIRKDGFHNTCKVCMKIYNKSYKRKITPTLRISWALRSRIHSALMGKSKSVHTVVLLGCTIDACKKYIEGLFLPGMTWENYGITGWHIDHRIPVSHFDLSDPEEQKKCFHFSNLQPLWATDNFQKSDKIEGISVRTLKLHKDAKKTSHTIN